MLEVKFGWRTVDFQVRVTDKGAARQAAIRSKVG
jgi:hypothetical protein